LRSSLRPEEGSPQEDLHLAAILEKYDAWLREGKIPYAGKVIPIREALPTTEWILPTDQAIEVLRRAASIALADCTCRTHYRRCERPLKTCLLLDAMADSFVAAGQGERISLERAEEVLKEANRHGLVHESVYNPDQGAWAICSCCNCCCYRLQILRIYGRDDLVVRSDYVAAVDPTLCRHCATCVGRCPFGAREAVAGGMAYTSERCLGCGLCVTTCPQGAIQLEERSRATARETS
jgi:ferredoxin